MATLTFLNNENADQIKKLVNKGLLTRVRNKVYIDTNQEDEIVDTLNSKWMEVAANLFDDAVLVARTAAQLTVADNYIYLVSDKIVKQRSVPVKHLNFILIPGNATDGIEPISMGLHRSDMARYCLENLVRSRGHAAKKKTLGAEFVERELIKEMRKRGEPSLNRLREEARKLAPLLELKKEFEQFNKMISSLLQTHPVEGVLQTRLGIAEAKGEPYDAIRMDRFEAYKDYLLTTQLQACPYQYNSAGWRNLTFFESYFSNYIEGTEFTLDEAEDIAFGKTIDYERHEDSHDILSHIEISGDMAEMSRTPASSNELIDILKIRHSILLAERPDKRPGQFKEKSNKAGGTDFVRPDHVEGTLVQGYEIYESLSPGLPRALFIHFLVSECHPFNDGNGRLSRIMLNAELVAAGLHKIIVPTVHRESYLNGMRSATRQNKFRTMTKVLHQLHCYTAGIEWLDYGDARSTLEKNAADKDPEQGVAIFNRVIAKLGSNYPAG